MSDERLRLRKLIEHWAEHNDEHAARYGESACEAEKMGLAQAVKNLRLASEDAARVSEHLRKALTAID